MFKGKWRSAGLISGVLILLISGSLSASQEDRAEGVGIYLEERSVEIRLKLLEKPSQEENKQPERVLDVLGVKEADVVADVGAGSGLFTFHLAPRVGPGGRVYAVEIEEKFIDLIRSKAEQRQIDNITLIKSSDADPNLPHSSCDKIVMAGVYYYLADPAAFMGAVRAALKPGGSLALIDLDEAKLPEKMKSKKKKIRKTDEIIEEMKRAGFELQEAHDFLPRRFLLVFTPAK